jgi:CoA:oxalate CoA-transferase
MMQEAIGEKQPPLSGLLVLDLTRVLAGPYCTMLLADLGARVIKIELPDTGDDARQIGPFVDDGKGVQASAYFFSVNRNKESLALDLKNPDDRKAFEALLEVADVLVENFTPGVLTRLGYSWEELQQRNPSLILASISGFGQTGPYASLPAYDMVVQAMGGMLSLTGEEGGAPTRVGVSIGDLSAGLFGALGVQAALIDRHRTGRGRHVDVSMLDCQVALLENALARFQIEGVAPGPIGSRHASITPFGLFKAQDGFIVIAAGNDAMFARLCRVLDLADLPLAPRFSTNALRCTNQAELKLLMENALASQPCRAWLTKLEQAGVPCGPMNDVAAVFADPQIEAREMLVEMAMSGGRTIRVAGNPVRFSGAPAPAHRPAPALDEHRAALWREFSLPGKSDCLETTHHLADSEEMK